MTNDWMSDEQLAVHCAIQRVGGYWEPKAAVLRLLEELAEFATAIYDGIGDPVEELADIKIISICLANQFQIQLPGGLGAPVGRDLVGEFSHMVQQAGRIARIVNFYAGPKSIRAGERLEGLVSPIVDLHCEVNALAVGLGVDLRAEVLAKAERMAKRDKNRFNQSFDPTTSSTLGAFKPVVSATIATFAMPSKLWGAPTWRADRSIEFNCEITVPYLTRFARAAIPESLGGFIIMPTVSSPPETAEGMEELAAEVLLSLGRLNPSHERNMNSLRPEPRSQFSFASLSMLVSVFSSLYPIDHLRRTLTGTFILFRPQQSTAQQSLPHPS